MRARSLSLGQMYRVLRGLPGTMQLTSPPNPRVWWCGALDLIAQGRLSLALYPKAI